jgi:hypothetical protein
VWVERGGQGTSRRGTPVRAAASAASVSLCSQLSHSTVTCGHDSPSCVSAPHCPICARRQTE